MTRSYQKKVALGVATRQTKWAPVWAVLKKFGQGQSRRTHPSELTAHRRHWRRTKLKLTPRRNNKHHLG